MFRLGINGRNFIVTVGIIIFSLLLTGVAFAADSKNLGDISMEITKSFHNLSKLITSGSYLLGLGFWIGTIMKFKQHKDNPTQIPVGTPIAMLFIAAALLFLPSIMGVIGKTVFGNDALTAGPAGIVFKTGNNDSYT